MSESGFRCEDTKYTDAVILIGKIIKGNKDSFLDKLTEITSGRISYEILGEKFDF
jgi:hypothetical protein